MSDNEKTSDVATLTVQLLGAYLTNNTVPSEELAGLIRSTRLALTADVATVEPEAETATFTPAVSVRKSLASPDHLISLVDGKPYKTLKRHLTTHGLTPDTYRKRYGLPATYPMVAPNFAALRRSIAEAIGLGNKKASNAAPADEAVSASAVSGKAKAEPKAAAVSTAAKPKKQTATATAAKASPRKNQPVSKSSAGPVDGVATAAPEPVSSPAPSETAAKLEAPVVAPVVTKTGATSADPSKAKKPPVKRMARGTAQAKKSASAAATSETAPADDTAPVAKTAKSRGKLGLFGKNVAETETGAPASAAADAKPRWKRPGLKAK
jgi:predicted transcriptional regulator